MAGDSASVSAQTRSEVVALDLDAARLKRVQENLARLKPRAKLIVGDAIRPSTWWDGKLFDRILLGAPCSSTGALPLDRAWGETCEPGRRIAPGGDFDGFYFAKLRQAIPGDSP